MSDVDGSGPARLSSTTTDSSQCPEGLDLGQGSIPGTPSFLEGDRRLQEQHNQRLCVMLEARAIRMHVESFLSSE